MSCVLGIFGAQRYLKRRNSCATDIAGLAVSRDLFCVGDWTVRVGIFENRPRQISSCALLRWIQTLYLGASEPQVYHCAGCTEAESRLQCSQHNDKLVVQTHQVRVAESNVARHTD